MNKARQIIPYHFTKNIREGFVSFFKKIRKCGGVVCFDFEDSISTLDRAQLSTLKARHRQDLLRRLNKVAQHVDSNFIGLRINGTGNAFFEDDIKALRYLSCGHLVFLPKVERVEQVQELLEKVPPTVKEIVPIIETAAGLRNCREIGALQDPRFLKMAFGHCDFNLSLRHFPFFHQDYPEYWEWIQELTQHAFDSGKQIINSPVLDLENQTLFSQVLRKNRQFGITGQITLCLSQTQWCGSSDSSNPNNAAQFQRRYPLPGKAAELVSRYEAHQTHERSFAIDGSRLLISPHEYCMAKFYLESALK